MAKRRVSARMHFDGLCEPNPGGIATYGFVITRGGKVLLEEGGPVEADPTTNNVAEYTGLVRGLERAVELGLADGGLEVRGDSQLVISQVSGKWKVRDPKLAPLFLAARELLMKFKAPRLKWVPREENKPADRQTYLAYVRVLARAPGETTSSPPSSS
jgi:ribonuclease HI